MNTHLVNYTAHILIYISTFHLTVTEECVIYCFGIITLFGRTQPQKEYVVTGYLR